jgi:pimeloyl-ACP methyl ester carboxylesterase
VTGIATMGAMWRDGPPAYGRLHEVGVPTLVVVGDHDQPDHVRTAKLLASEITGARLEILPLVDHNVPVRAGPAFTGLLAGFLDQLNHPDWREVS